MAAALRKVAGVRLVLGFMRMTRYVDAYVILQSAK